jgi:uncharacterized membrane protein
MVAVHPSGSQGDRCIVLRPNTAPNWREALWVYGFLTVTCLGIAGYFASAGFWLALPFAGLEIGLLGWGLYVSARRSCMYEVVWVRSGTVEIQREERGSQRHCTFDRYWTEVRLVPAAYRLHSSRLFLRSRGYEIELGQFLPEGERAHLALQLKRLIGPMAAWGDGV